MKKYYALILFLLTINAASYAQNNRAYLIPRMIYVGDPAVLVLPLPGQARDGGDVVLTAPQADFPSNANIIFHRITLEKRAAASRLMIEFTAFTTGVIELPAIEIEGELFSGLTVSVNSIVDSRLPPVLSGPASALAMPGTALMLYGSMTAFAFFILLSIWFALRGRRFLKEWNKKWRRYRLFASMKKTEKRLQRAAARGTDKRIILDKLSEQFRIFLSFFTDRNCRAMTAREFGKLPPEFFQAQELDPEFLTNFFQTCDSLRFSGVNIDSRDITKLLDDLRLFLGALENSKKGKDRQEAAA
jgi:hypothetical protein